VVRHGSAQVANLATLSGEGSMSMDEARNTREVFEAVNVSGVVEGWRCLYADPITGIVQKIVPMAGWAVWKRRQVDAGTGELLIDRGTLLEAVVIHLNYPVCAMELPDVFMFDYLRPGQPSPEIGSRAPDLEADFKGKPGERRGGPRPGPGGS
jgi:hypothetical protein